MARLILPLALGCILCASQSAWAQRLQRYQPPYGPTLSPYLEYYRRPSGVLNNYHMFVRPRVELRQTLRSQQQQILTLDRELRRAAVSQVREAEVAPTGTGSGFMNYSHYYPSAGASGRR
jgi:hypothetical protein